MGQPKWDLMYAGMNALAFMSIMLGIAWSLTVGLGVSGFPIDFSYGVVTGLLYSLAFRIKFAKMKIAEWQAFHA